jgi:hypothetical protein
MGTIHASEASGTGLVESKHSMAEKAKKLGLKRDYAKYLYFLDKDGNVCRRPKSGEGKTEIVVEHAIDRDNQYLYFIDKDGDVSRSPRVTRGSKPKAA